MSLVVDASIAIAWSFTDEHTIPVMALLDQVETDGAWAPSLWPLEVLNTLLMAERRRRVDPPRREIVRAMLHGLPIELDSDTASAAWGRTTDLALQFRLTLYDAAYLELAERRRLPLATLDRALREAAGGLGIVTLGLG